MANEVEIVITSKDKSKAGFDAASKEAEKYGGKLESVGERADKGEQKILGMKDTVDGVATIMQGPGKQGIAAYLQGWADLASGVANFVIPAMGNLTKAAVKGAIEHVRAAARTVGAWVVMATQATLNAARMAVAWVVAMGPIGWAIGLLILIGGALVILWKKSETFRRIVKASLAAVGDAASWLWEHAIKPAFAAIGDAITDTLSWFRRLPGRILAVFRNAARWLLQKGRDVVDGLWDGLKAVWGVVFPWVKGIPGRVIGTYANAGKWLYTKGREILGGLWDGLKQKWSDVINWFRGIPGRFLEALHIKSPPDWAISAGRHIMDGLIKGLGGKDRIVAKVRDLAGGMARTAAGALGRAVGIAPPTTGGVQSMVKGYASMLYGWTGRQWDALYNLIMGESGFNPNAQNPNSSAYGIFQFLDSTWAGVNAVKTSNANAQTLAGLRYIARTYDNPVNAYSAWLSRSPHWYGSGGLITEPVMGIGLRSGDTYGFGERGVETVTPGDARGGGRVVLEIRSSGSRVDDLLVEVLRSAVRVRGGNVQTVLGRA